MAKTTIAHAETAMGEKQAEQIANAMQTAKATHKPKPTKKHSSGGISHQAAARLEIGQLVKQVERAFTEHAQEGLQQPRTRAQAVEGVTNHPDEIAAAVEAVMAARDKYPGRLAIGFKSGAVCLYDHSDTADYIGFMAAGSKGKWVWARGWGPTGHPSYSRISPDPHKILADAAVASSWCTRAWLIAD